jgi:hypothetical protein
MFDLDPWEKIIDNRISTEPKISPRLKPILRFLNKIKNEILKFFRKSKIVKKKNNNAISTPKEGEE